MVRYQSIMKRMVSRGGSSFAEAKSIAKVSTDDNETKTGQTVSVNVSVSNNGNSSSISSCSSSIK